MIRSFRLLLMAETLKVSPLLILSIRDLAWFCCASSDSRSFQTAGCVQDSNELNEWWNDSRALVFLVYPVPALSSTFHMWCENIGGSRLPPTACPIFYLKWFKLYIK